MRTITSATLALSLILGACGDDEAEPDCASNASCEPSENPSTIGDAAAPPNADAGGNPVGSDAGAGALDGAAADPADGATNDAQTGDAGASGADAAAPQGGSGCGAANSPKSGTYMLDVDGTQRKYIVSIPDNYDANKPYKLIFAWHGLGGTAEQIAGTQFGGRFGYYGLQQRAAGSAIFVAGQGLETGTGGAGWPNTNGRDVAFVRKLVDTLNTQYCIDQERIFSVGMSYGGIMSNTLGCQMGDVFRAIAPIAGSGPRVGGFGGSTCKGQVAAWVAHGNTDNVVTFASGQASRDYWLKANHCQAQTQPTTPMPCVAYQGCDAGHPVHWCEFNGGHTVPQFVFEAIWGFFSQF